MPKPKGTPKTPGSGRKPGSLNKKTDLMAQCEAKGVNVWEKLLEYLVYPCDPAMRLQAIKIACPYLYATNKAIEHSGTIENPYMAMELKELEKLIKDKLKNK